MADPRIVRVQRGDRIIRVEVPAEWNDQTVQEKLKPLMEQLDADDFQKQADASFESDQRFSLVDDFGEEDVPPVSNEKPPFPIPEKLPKPGLKQTPFQLDQFKGPTPDQTFGVDLEPPSNEAATLHEPGSDLGFNIAALDQPEIYDYQKNFMQAYTHAEYLQKEEAEGRLDHLQPGLTPDLAKRRLRMKEYKGNLEGYLEQAKPREMLESLGIDAVMAKNVFKSGLWDMVSDIASGGYWLTEEEQLGAVAKEVQEFSDEAMPKFYTPDGAPPQAPQDSIAGGIKGLASQIIFLGPSLAIRAGGKVAAKLFGKKLAASTKMADAYAVFSESLTEAGGTYENMVEQGFEEDVASDIATTTFWANVALIAWTNKYGVLGDSATNAIFSEGFQEIGQTYIPEKAKDFKGIQNRIGEGEFYADMSVSGITGAFLGPLMQSIPGAIKLAANKGPGALREAKEEVKRALRKIQVAAFEVSWDYYSKENREARAAAEAEKEAAYEAEVNPQPEEDAAPPAEEPPAIEPPVDVVPPVEDPPPVEEPTAPPPPVEEPPVDTGPPAEVTAIVNRAPYKPISTGENPTDNESINTISAIETYLEWLEELKEELFTHSMDEDVEVAEERITHHEKMLAAEKEKQTAKKAAEKKRKREQYGIPEELPTDPTERVDMAESAKIQLEDAEGRAADDTISDKARKEAAEEASEMIELIKALGEAPKTDTPQAEEPKDVSDEDITGDLDDIFGEDTPPPATEEVTDDDITSEIDDIFGGEEPVTAPTDDATPDSGPTPKETAKEPAAPEEAALVPSEEHRDGFRQWLGKKKLLPAARATVMVDNVYGEEETEFAGEALYNEYVQTLGEAPAEESKDDLDDLFGEINEIDVLSRQILAMGGTKANVDKAAYAKLKPLFDKLWAVKADRGMSFRELATLVKDKLGADKRPYFEKYIFDEKLEEVKAEKRKAAEDAVKPVGEDVSGEPEGEQPGSVPTPTKEGQPTEGSEEEGDAGTRSDDKDRDAADVGGGETSEREDSSEGTRDKRQPRPLVDITPGVLNAATNSRRLFIDTYNGWMLWEKVRKGELVFDELTDAQFKMLTKIVPIGKFLLEQGDKALSETDKAKVQALPYSLKLSGAGALLSDEIIGALWEALKNANVTGKVVAVEALAGRLYGKRPADLEGITPTMTSGGAVIEGLLRELYPDANIHGTPGEYESASVPDNYYDGGAVVGNAETILGTIKKTRPGGVVVVYTNVEFMDDSMTHKDRRAIYELADLVRVIRIPNDAARAMLGLPESKSNNKMGDAVDIIVFRRHDEGVKPKLLKPTIEGGDETTSKKGAYPGEVVYDTRGEQRWVNSQSAVVGDGYVYGPTINTIFHTPRDEVNDLEQGDQKEADPYLERGVLLGELQVEKDTQKAIYVSKHGKLSKLSTKPLAEKTIKAITEALDVLKTDEFQQSEPAAKKAIENPDPKNLPFPGDHLEGNFVEHDGKFNQLINGVLVPLSEMKKKEQSMLRGMMELRDAQRDLMISQFRPESDEKLFKKALNNINKIYDEFVRKFGYLNDESNRALFALDTDAHTLLALEEKYTPPGKGRTRGEAIKSKILLERTITPYSPVEQVDTEDDALNASLNEYGRIDLDYMAEISGVERELIADRLGSEIVKDPVSGEWMLRDRYISGNIDKKILEIDQLLEAMLAEGNEERGQRKHLQNLKYELNRARKEEIKSEDVPIQPGAPWIPQDLNEEFVNELIPPTQRGSRTRIYYSRFKNQWIVVPNQKVKDNNDATQQPPFGWGHSVLYHGYKLFQHMLNQTQPKITRKQIADKNDRMREQQVIATIIAKMRERFIEWLTSDQSRSRWVTSRYNDIFRQYNFEPFKSDHLTFPGMTTQWIEDMYPHQRNAIARGIFDQFVAFGHEVGTGKTLSLIATAVERKRLGLSKNPIVVTLKSNNFDIVADARRFYPGLKVMAFNPDHPEWKGANKFKTAQKVKNGEYDLVIMTHQQLQQFMLSPEHLTKLYDEELAELRAELHDVGTWASSPDVKKLKDFLKNRRTFIEKERVLVEARIRTDKLRGERMPYFEEMGFDYIALDEAHKFKNLLNPTRLGAIRGIPIPKKGVATEDLVNKLDYIREIGGGAAFGTGTLIANSMAEMYNIFRYLAPNMMKDLGLGTLDQWLSTFAQPQSEFTIGPDNSVKEIVRFARWVGIQELLDHFYGIADLVRTVDIPGIELPKVFNENGTEEATIVQVKQSPAQKKAMQHLLHRYELLQAGEPLVPNDNFLWLMGDGINAALGGRVYNADFIEEISSKTVAVVENIVSVYKQFAEDKGTQIVFIDRSVPLSSQKKKLASDTRTPAEVAEEKLNPKEEPEITESEAEVNDDEIQSDAIKSVKRFSIYDQIRDELVKAGVPEAEIAYIHSWDGKRAQLYEKVRAGEIRIVLGSRAKLGEGVNMQDKIVALHHLDVPWVPSWLIQADGRGIRKGNWLGLEHGVRKYNYVTEGTMDTYMWQTVSSKAKTFAEILSGKFDGRIAEDLSAAVTDYETAMAHASGRPEILEMVRLERLKDELEYAKEGHDKRIAAAKRELPTIRQRRERHEREVQELEDFIAARKSTRGGDFELLINPDIELQKDRKKGAARLSEYLQEKAAWIRGGAKAGIGETGRQDTDAGLGGFVLVFDMEKKTFYEDGKLVPDGAFTMRIKYGSKTVFTAIPSDFRATPENLEKGIRSLEEFINAGLDRKLKREQEALETTLANETLLENIIGSLWDRFGELEEVTRDYEAIIETVQLNDRIRHEGEPDDNLILAMASGDSGRNRETLRAARMATSALKHGKISQAKHDDILKGYGLPDIIPTPVPTPTFTVDEVIDRLNKNADANGPILSPHDMIILMATRLGAAVRHKGWRFGKAIGLYFPPKHRSGGHIIDLKRYGDATTFWHELGHWMETIFLEDDRTERAFKRIVGQFVPFAPRAPAAIRHKEGFAEFIRYYVTQPDELLALEAGLKTQGVDLQKLIAAFEKVAGRFEATPGTVMGKPNPFWKGRTTTFLEALQDGRILWDLWHSSPTTLKLNAMIEDSVGAARRRKKTSEMPFLDGIYTLVWNSLYPTSAPANEVRQIRKHIKEANVKLPEDQQIPDVPWGFEDDPEAWAKVSRGVTGQVVAFLEIGTFIIDAKDGIKQTGEPFYNILGDLQKMKLPKEFQIKLKRPANTWMGKAISFFSKMQDGDVRKSIKKAGLQDTILPKGMNIERLFEIYLIAKRAQHDVRIRTGLAHIFGKGDFTMIVTELEPIFEDIGKRYYAYNHELLLYLVSTGRINMTQLTMMEEKNPFYTPMLRVVDDKLVGQGPRVGRTLLEDVNPLKAMSKVGSGRMILSPLESTILNTVNIINSGAKNRVGAAYVNFANMVDGVGKIARTVPTKLKPQAVNTMQTLQQIAKMLDEIKKENKGSEVAKKMTEHIKGLISHQKVVNKILGMAMAAEQEGGEGTQALIDGLMEKNGLTKDDLWLLHQTLTVLIPNWQPSGNMVIFYDKGKPYTMEMDQSLYKALWEAGTYKQHNVMVNLLAIPANFLRVGATAASPFFPLRNIIKDQGGAFLNTDYGYGSIYGIVSDIIAYQAKKDAKKNGKAVIEIVDEVTGEIATTLSRDALDKAAAEALQKFAGDHPFWVTMLKNHHLPIINNIYEIVRGLILTFDRGEGGFHLKRLAAGGTFSDRSAGDVNQMDDILRMTDMMINGQITKWKGFDKHLWMRKVILELGVNPFIMPYRFVRAINILFEEITRNSVAHHAYKHYGNTTAGLLHSGIEGREGTTDFGQFGQSNIIQIISRWVPFYNPKIQGSMKTMRVVKKRPFGTLYRLAQISVLPTVLVNLLWGDDDEYRKMSSFRRLSGLNIKIDERSTKIARWMMPDDLYDLIISENADGSSYYWIPMPHFLGTIFHATTEMAMEDMRDRDGLPEDFAKDVALSFGEDVSGLNLDFENLKTNLPSFLKTPAQWMDNTNYFYQSSIVPRGKEGLEAHLQYTDRTKPVTKWFTKMLYDLNPDMFDDPKSLNNPAKIEDAINSTFATAGRLGLEAVDAVFYGVTWLTDKDAFDALQTPVRREYSVFNVPAGAFGWEGPGKADIRKFRTKLRRLNIETDSWAAKQNIPGIGNLKGKRFDPERDAIFFRGDTEMQRKFIQKRHFEFISGMMRENSKVRTIVVEHPNMDSKFKGRVVKGIDYLNDYLASLALYQKELGEHLTRVAKLREESTKPLTKEQTNFNRIIDIPQQYLDALTELQRDYGIEIKLGTDDINDIRKNF